jgi:hypothetical protein
VLKYLKYSALRFSPRLVITAARDVFQRPVNNHGVRDGYSKKIAVVADWRRPRRYGGAILSFVAQLRICRGTHQ